MRFTTAFLSILLGLCLAKPCYATEPPFSLPAKEELLKLRSALIKTNKGELYFELYPEDAPWHVANLKFLADKAYYKGLAFHLFIPGYIIQGGAPYGKPNGGPGYSLPPEFSPRKHERGTLGMARRPDFLNPGRRSNGGQFHVLLSEAKHMDGTYTIMGKLTKGFDVLDKLIRGDTIQSVQVFVRSEP